MSESNKQRVAIEKSEPLLKIVTQRKSEPAHRTVTNKKSEPH